MTWLAVIFSLCFAKWCQQVLAGFYERVNFQVYQEYQALVGEVIPFSTFQQRSNLKAKSTPLSMTFYLIFPLFVLWGNNYWVSLIFILLYFLSVLDYYYHLIDSRYIAAIFLSVLIYKMHNAEIETLIFTAFFFIFILGFSRWVYKKEVFGMGDVLIFIALSPLFPVAEMLRLILSAALFGIGFWLLYFCKTKRKLDRLPFIPFISLATAWCFYR